MTSVGGTSCASPIFASYIALVNDRLIANGKPVLGFLNPILYGKLKIPSLHVVGKKDEEWYEGGKTVCKNYCEKGTSRLVEHDGGHIVPKDKRTVDRVIDEVDMLL